MNVDSAMRVRRPGMKWDWQHGLAGLRDDAPRHAQRHSAAGVEGAGGTGGHGRASRSTTPSRRLACGDLAGGRALRRPEHPWGNKQQQAGRPPPTGTHSGRARRRPEHQRRHKKHSTGARARRPAPLDATTQTRTLRSTCVRSRSARAARRSRRSSRSPRLRRRAGPHRLSRACRRPWCRCARHPRPRPRRPRTRP